MNIHIAYQSDVIVYKIPAIQMKEFGTAIEDGILTIQNLLVGICNP